MEVIGQCYLKMVLVIQIVYQSTGARICCTGAIERWEPFLLHQQMVATKKYYLNSLRMRKQPRLQSILWKGKLFRSSH